MAPPTTDRVEAAYRRVDRLDKRVRMMAAWAKLLRRVEALGQVIALQGKKA